MQTVFLDDIYKLIRTRELERVIAEVESEINSPDILLLFQQIQAEKDITVMPTRDFVMPPRPEPGSRGRGNPMLVAITKEHEVA